MSDLFTGNCKSKLEKGGKLATPQGFEPQLSGPKPLVLPLHHGVA